MLVLKIELWPHGDRKRSKVIATGIIVNDGTGDLKTGNYDCIFADGPDYLDSLDAKMVRVEGFERTKKSVWQLVYNALTARFRKG